MVTLVKIVSSLLSLLLTSAPFLINTSATFRRSVGEKNSCYQNRLDSDGDIKLPLIAAICNGVNPESFLESTTAPFLIKRSTDLSLPVKNDDFIPKILEIL